MCVSEFFPLKLQTGYMGCPAKGCQHSCSAPLYTAVVAKWAPDAFALYESKRSNIAVWEFMRNQRNIKYSSEMPMAEVIDRVWLGSEGDALNLLELQSTGITDIVVAAAASRVYFPGVFTCHDARGLDVTKATLPLQKIAELIARILASDPNKKVLVHCLEGLSRSAALVAGYMLLAQKPMPTVSTVLQQLRDKRPAVAPNHGFRAQLKELRIKYLARK
jgi:protein-tyrosine phosphatase